MRMHSILLILAGLTLALAVAAILLTVAGATVRRLPSLIRGPAALTADRLLLAIAGALFHMFNNALYKGLLFLTAGAVFLRAGTRNLNRLGGLGHSMGLAGMARCARAPAWLRPRQVAAATDGVAVETTTGHHHAATDLHVALHATLPQHQRLHGAVSALPHTLDAGFQRQGHLGLL